MKAEVQIGDSVYEIEADTEESLSRAVNSFVNEQVGIDGRTGAAPVAPRQEEQMAVERPERPQERIMEEDETSPTREVFQGLEGLGYRPETIAGIMANIDVETGGTFDFQQQQHQGPGYGLFQLDPTGPLPQAYQQFLEEEGREDSTQSQLDFAHETIYGDYQDIIGRGNARRLRRTFERGDAEEVARDFMDIWERPGVPHWDRRREAAHQFSEQVSQWRNNG